MPQFSIKTKVAFTKRPSQFPIKVKVVATKRCRLSFLSKQRLRLLKVYVHAF